MPPTAHPESHQPVLPPGNEYRFHAMLKPSGAQCNLDCAYCFYLHKEELLGQPKAPRMSDEVLEQHIRQYIEAQTGPEVIFSWQGGEPTLMGLPFFEKVVALQAKYRKPGQAIENDLQTNGLLLDEDWARFLKAHTFLVGLSCDGPEDLHDRYRVTVGGQPTHARVVAAARLLQQHRVPFAALAVINRENAREPRRVHRFLVDELGALRVQYIPCVEPKVFRKIAPRHWPTSAQPMVGAPEARPGHPDSVVTDWSVDPEDWGRFLCGVWDSWLKHDYGRIHVNHFETVVAQSLGLPSQMCTSAEFCGKGLAVEHTGDVFACDHFVYPEFKLGNLKETHLGDMAFSEGQKAFGFAKRDTLPDYCRQCRHLNLCWGECPKSRFLRTPDGQPGLNYLCQGFKHFYGYIQRDLPGILRKVRGF